MREKEEMRRGKEKDFNINELHAQRKLRAQRTTLTILCILIDAILPRKGPVTRAMSKRLQEDWARATEEGLKVLMNLGVDF